TAAASDFYVERCTPRNNAIQRTDRHDTTLIFSDENEMDMTASHTAVITRNLKNNQADKTEKIDITSFLAGLNSTNGKKEDAMTVKKIDFNEFLMSLKSNEKALNPVEGPEKENVFFGPSQVSEDMAQSSVEFVYSHEPLDTCNVTKVFRGQEDGMEMTKCQVSDVKAMFSGICEAPPEQFLHADVTEAFVDDGMDMTTSHTAKMSFPFSGVRNQSRNFGKDFPSTELDNSVVKRASNQHLIVQHDPQLCTDKKLVNVEDRRDPPVPRTVKQEARTMSAIPGSISSETVFRGDKTVVFSKCDDMEITDNYTDVICNDSTKEMNSSCHKTFEKPVNTNSLLAENRHLAHGGRDVTKSLTALDNRAVSYKNSALELSLGSDEQIKKVTQDTGTASVNVGFDSCTNSGSAGVPMSRLQHRPANSQLVSLPGERTVIFSGEDMDLTKTCVVGGDGKNVENESPAGVFTSAPCKPHFLDNRSTSPSWNEQAEMELTKCHAIVIDDQSNGITAEAKQMCCKIIPRKNQNKNASEVRMVDKNLGKTNFQASGPGSCAKSVCSLQEQKREVPENTVTNTCAFVSLQSQKVGMFQPLGKTLPNTSVCCTNDKEDMFSDDENMDITKIHPSVVFPSGENMDLTGNCVVMVPDYNISAVLSERKAVPGYLDQDENKIMPLKGVVMSRNSQEQPVCRVYSLASGKKMFTTSALKRLPLADEQTTIFSEDADMDITRSHTVSADKVILQRESSNDDTCLISGDKTCVFTYNDDMEISRLDTVVIDKCMEKAVSQGMLNMAKRTGRKSLKGTTGEKTVLFSLSDVNNDMEITESHTAAIGHEIVSQNEGGLCSSSSAHPVKTVTFTSSQADVDITKSCSADKITVKVVCDDKPNLGKETGQQVPSNSEATVLAVDDMDITRTRNGALEENPLQGGRPNRSVPLTSTVMFASYQADMEMTSGLNLPASGSKTIIFTSAEEMEITATPTAVLSGEMDVQARESIPAISAAPADKTIVFTHNQDDMEITASHTTALNNNINGFENQELSHKSTRQPDLHSALLSSCREEGDSPHTKDLNGEYHTKSEDKPSLPSASSASESPNKQGAIKVPSSTPPDSVYSVSLPEETVDVRAPQDLDLPMDNSVPVNSQQDLIPPENLKSKGESFKLPSNGPMGHSEESGDLVPRVSLPIQQSDSLEGSPDASSTQRNQVLKDDSSRHEDLATDLGLAGAGLVPVSNKELKENEGLSAEGETPPKHFQINSEQTKPPLVSPRDHIGPTLAPELSGILNVCSKLKNMRRKSTVLSVSETAFSDELPKPSTQSEDSLRLGKDTVNESNNLFYTKEQENTCLESGAAPIDANLGVALKDKYQGINVPLGIFRPKLPNRRNPSVSSVQDINAKSLDKGEAPVSEVTVNAGETPGNNRPSRQNFSPSQFIAEEFLPVCLEEMDSNESVSSELMENSPTRRIYFIWERP
uniref:Knl1 C-terminal RWD domain-containing protein n=1 Tax=Strix occidentalis caurina TaxID=311401 RepID=A0A8D0FX72_STROC